jgi:hypothetical protein
MTELPKAVSRTDFTLPLVPFMLSERCSGYSAAALALERLAIDGARRLFFLLMQAIVDKSCPLQEMKFLFIRPLVAIGSFLRHFRLLRHTLRGLRGPHGCVCR